MRFLGRGSVCFAPWSKKKAPHCRTGPQVGEAHRGEIARVERSPNVTRCLAMALKFVGCGKDHVVLVAGKAGGGSGFDRARVAADCEHSVPASSRSTFIVNHCCARYGPPLVLFG
jgi:hypothetical protein